MHPRLVALMLHISDRFIDYLPMPTGRQSPYSEFDPRHAGATIPSWTFRSPPRGFPLIPPVLQRDRNPAVKQIVRAGEGGSVAGRQAGKEAASRGGSVKDKARARWR